MTDREKEILKLIKDNPFISQEEIASILNIARSSVAIHITNLIKKGYILGRGYIVNKNNYVLVIGGSNIDITGFPKNDLISKDSNPGVVNMSLGGVGRNIAENLAKLDLNVKFITAIGNDIYGEKIIKHSKEIGIDIGNSLISSKNQTSIYLAILNNDRDMEVAISHMDICDELTIDFFKSRKGIILNSEVLILDTNLPKESIEYLLETYKNPIFLDTVSTTKTEKVKDIIGRFHTIKPNKLEAEILTNIKINDENDAQKACEVLIDKGVKQVFLTMGENGIICANEKEIIKIESPKIKVTNATGAGDAFTAALVYSYLNDYDLKYSGSFAIGASIIALQSKNTISEDLNVENIKKIIKEMEIC
ncbi:PfkB family carbohydrate kinase [Marinitoga aeolica]|uniref:Winged helix-turn-helix transcriptional regulator n=1 Tax=Marinitoga aeolica TaxID=2809031 RepID=A0ABY8PQP1_9BACT|nr:PfkB family carbohydrate kinase [Marinitoga aeolica]WGS64932.1 winged helix-turn-helix transcriptional regulator [Marinitoga aeolica]